ncbi:MAG: hypothetical protein ABIC36_02015 [bacterium]
MKKILEITMIILIFSIVLFAYSAEGTLQQDISEMYTTWFNIILGLVCLVVLFVVFCVWSRLPDQPCYMEKLDYN